MDIISILGLVLGLAVLIMMGFKGWGMIPTSIVGALVVVITNRMDLWEALSTHYGTFMKNYAGDYFLMFFLGTLFGALMGSSGAAKSIACKIVDLMGSIPVRSEISMASRSSFRPGTKPMPAAFNRLSFHSSHTMLRAKMMQETTIPLRGAA